MNQGQASLALPELVTFQGTCDMCGAEQVQVGRFRIEQVRTTEHKSVSRNVLLCVSCRAPLLAILKSVEQKQDRTPTTVFALSDLVETPALRAQRVGAGVKSTRKARTRA